MRLFQQPAAMTGPLRVWGCVGLALVLFLSSVGVPSSQASDVLPLQAAWEDWDEVDSSEDKGLWPLSDHQPDLAGAGWPIAGAFGFTATAPAAQDGPVASLLSSLSVSRAPPLA